MEASGPPRMNAEFDQFADRYRQAMRDAQVFAGTPHEFYLQLKIDYLLAMARRRLGAPASLRVLDAGCGIGLMSRLLVGKVASVVGVDLSSQSIERAAADVPGASFRVCSPESLNCGDGEFDVAFASCVLHHVPPPARAGFAAEMARVVRPGGAVVIFEHNPLNPLTRLTVARCEFDRDAILLWPRETRRWLAGAGLCAAESPYLVFFPFRGAALRAVERRIAWLPAGAQYAVTALRPAATSPRDHAPSCGPS